jgi:membrane fusion protein, multidrug efflux system
MSRGIKIFFWILFLALVVVVFVWQGRSRLQTDEVLSIEDVQATEGIPVDIVIARVQTLEDWRRFTGVAEGWEQVDLISDFRTRVVGVPGRLGEEVSAGELIMSLDPSDPSRIMMNRDAALAQYMSAKADSGRIEALYAQGAVALQQLEQVRTMTTAARVVWEGASKAVDLRTPVAGIITSLNAEVDRYTEGGAVVATIASLDRIRLRIALSVDERDMLQEGQLARIRLNDASLLTGTVHKLALSADSETRLYDAEIAIENRAHRLTPGMLVAVEVLVDDDRKLPLLPATSIIRRDGKLFCYVAESGDPLLASFREITPSIQGDKLVAAASGLSAGDRVVVAGQSKLEDGVKVSIHSDLSDTYYGEMN